MKQIFEYTDYRVYLRDVFEDLKKKDSKISLQFLSQKLGQSKTALKYVFDGVRHISDDKISDFIRVFNFEGDEAQYFKELVFYNKAKNTEKQSKHYGNMLKMKTSQVEEKYLEKDKIGVFTDWFYPIISEMRDFLGFESSESWIQKRMMFTVSKESIKSALRILKQHDLIERNNQKIKIKIKNRIVSQIYKNYVFKQLELSKQALSLLSSDDIEFFTLTVAIDERRFALLKNRIEAFRHELHDLLASDNVGDRIVQVNMQSFIVAKDKNVIEGN